MLLVPVEEMLLEGDESLVGELVEAVLEVAEVVDDENEVELGDESMLELEMLVVLPLGLSGILEDDAVETDVEGAELEVELLVKLVVNVL